MTLLSRKYFALLATAVGVLVLGAIWHHPPGIADIESAVRAAGWLGPLVFIALYVAGTLVFVPGAVMDVAGGVLFGPWEGTIYSLIGAVAGASLSFLIARYIASDWISQRLSGRIKDIINQVEAEGWRFVALVRLVPLLPFGVVNYSLGLMQLRLSHYVVASFVCMIPGTFAYNYLGYAGQQAMGGGEFLLYKLLIGFGILATLVAIPLVIQRARRRLVVEQAVKSPI